MKNANSRFVRVLAVALVVLMVLPAALVGCGSNKANDAAISEALAAAQAAKDAADKAQQKAEAAQKELEEANKKAEQLEAELEALKTTKAPEDTTAPVTTPVDKQAVIMYGIDAVEAIAKDLEAAGKIGKTAGLYAEADWQAILDYEEMTGIAINKAATIDEITEIVEAFYAYVEAMPTYAERVYEAYKAIDFASDLDVVDVVYAYNYLIKTVLGNGKIAIETDDNKNAVIVYGEEELNLASLICTEYYRYTGVSDKYNYAILGDIKPLYKEMHNAAKRHNVKGALEALNIANDKGVWGIENILYTATVQKDAETIKENIEDWYDRFFKGEALEANYEAFRQAFIGEDVILELNKDEDALWPIVLAAKDRADALEVAHDEYIDVIGDDVDDIILSVLVDDVKNSKVDLAKDSDDNTVVYLAEVDAKLAEFFAKHTLGDPANESDLKVILSVAPAYENYLKAAKIVSYLVALEKTASSLNTDAFAIANKQYDRDLEGRFDFAKYGSVVNAVNEWYDRFYAIDPEKTSGYEKYKGIGEKYAVKNLASAPFFNDIFENVFDETYAAFLLIDSKLELAYDNLNAKKFVADDINLAVKKFLSGVTKKDKAEVARVLGNDITVLSNFFAKSASKRDDLISTLGGQLKVFFEAGTIKYGDVNCDAMVDWEALEQLSDNFDAMKAEANDAAVEIMDLYLRTIATLDPQDGRLVVTNFEGKDDFKLAKGTKTLVIDVYAYDTIKNISALVDKIDVTADIFSFSPNLTFAYEPAKGVEIANFSYKKAYQTGLDLIGKFHVEMAAIENIVNDVATALPLFARPKKDDVVKYWNDGVVTVDKLVADILYKHNGKFDDSYKDAETKEGRKANVKAYVDEKLKYFHGNVGSDYDGYYVKKSAAKFEDQTTWGNDFYGIGFYDAVISVNPLAYTTIKFVIENGVETNIVDTANSAFNSKEYAKALEAALDKNFAEFAKKFVNYKDAASNDDSTGINAAFESVITKIADTAFKYDLWTIEKAIYGEKYSYVIDDFGAGVELKLYNRSGDLVPGNTIGLGEWGKNDDEVTVTFSVEAQTVIKNFVNVNKVGAYVVKATVSKTAEAEAAIKAAGYVDDAAFLKDKIGFDVKEHSYDVRDAAAELGAKFAKFNDVEKITVDAKYPVATEAQLKTIFDAEAKAYNNYQLVLCGKVVFSKNTSTGAIEYGEYVKSKLETTPITDGDKLNSLLITTVKYQEMLSDASLEDARVIVENFKDAVNAYFAN